MDKMKHKAKVTLNQTRARVKERIYSFTGTSSATVKEIADFIKNHPDKKVTKKDLLGFTFTFYEMDLDGVHYYLEMKNTKVLQVDVHTPLEQMVSYRSYRDHYSLNTPIKFPELVN